MIQTVYSGDFIDAFRACGRYEQFGYEALNALYDYLEDLDSSYELDVIALCCSYSVSSPEDVIESYDVEVDDDMTDEEKADAARDYLEANGVLIAEFRNGDFLYCSDF